MVSKKILKSTVSLALTASVALLAGCPGPGAVTPSAEPTSGASVTPSAEPTTPGTTDPSASAVPSPSNSTNPDAPTGQNPDISTLATFNGKVFDVAGSPLEDATVTATSIDPNVTWTGEAQATIGGSYVFRNAPVGARLAITATKAGYTTRTRTEVLKSNLTGDPEANKFDFGGSTGASIYALQDEPQVTSVRVNGTLMDRGGEAGYQSPLGATSGATNLEVSQGQVLPNTNVLDSLFPHEDVAPGASGISRDKLEVELTFSEPVNRNSVENNFKLFSETENNNDNRVPNQFTVDRNYAGVTFDWADDDRKVTIKADKPLYTGNDSTETRYTVTFEDPFEDKAGTDAEELRVSNFGVGNAWGYFRFSTTQQADYATFSVQRDRVDPTLVSISALDNRGNEDIVILNFSEPMDVINVRSLGVDLIGPQGASAPSTENRQLWTEESGMLTQLGYNATAGANPRVVYSLTRVNNNGVNPTAFGAGPVGGGTAGSAPTAVPAGLFNDATLSNDGRTLTLRFDDNAFERNDRIIVAVGNAIEDNDASFNTNRNGNVNTGELSAGTDANLEDPAGNDFSDSNESESSNVTVNDAQKVVTAAG